jgi:octaheme c-type cytochrome (tetrathionate reductase family)
MHAAIRTGQWLALLGLLVWAGAASAADETTADHSKFIRLQADFQSGPEVTRACLTCHTEAAKQVMKTRHWTYEGMNPNAAQVVGKKRLANNFCVGISSNYSYCTSCHVGYGWKDKKFDFSVEQNVDCLVCHDTTGTYRKPSGLAGHPVYQEMEFPPGSGEILRPVDLRKVAQSVGRSSRYNCGACHFYSGGGDGVKHGDLDSSLGAPDRQIDVHMDALGNDFSCATCHLTTGHRVPGSRYAPTAKDRGGLHLRGRADPSNPATCEACHGNRPHSLDSMVNRKPPPGFTKLGLASMLNNHTEKIACQTCHIPAMARGGVPTKLFWDWSQAGKMGPDGKPQYIKNDTGQVVYDSKKGAFKLGEQVTPEYMWFNGTVKYRLLEEKVDKTDGILTLNRFEGSPNDGKSRIWPVKVFRGVQPYDPVNKTLIVPHTYGYDENSYFKHFDWKKAAAAGMADVGLPFSGQVDFIQTESLWPITHMVAPREQALACKECHNKRGSLSEGRLKDVPGLKRIAPMNMP